MSNENQERRETKPSQVQHLGKGFQLLARRWLVEKTFAWLINAKTPLSGRYEKLSETSKSLIYIAQEATLLLS